MCVSKIDFGNWVSWYDVISYPAILDYCFNRCLRVVLKNLVFLWLWGRVRGEKENA